MAQWHYDAPGGSSGVLMPSSSAMLPPSATHAAVAWAGVATMLAAVAVLNFWPPFEQIAYLALIVMGCTALGIFLPDLLWQKVQRRALAPMPDPATGRAWRSSASA